MTVYHATETESLCFQRYIGHIHTYTDSFFSIFDSEFSVVSYVIGLCLCWCCYSQLSFLVFGGSQQFMMGSLLETITVDQFFYLIFYC